MDFSKRKKTWHTGHNTQDLARILSFGIFEVMMLTDFIHSDVTVH